MASSFPSPNDKRYDLVQSFDALALAGKHREDKVQNVSPFIGGFHLPGNANNHVQRPPPSVSSKSSPTNANQPRPPTFPVPGMSGNQPGRLPRPPAMMPMPTHQQGQQSLTMQHALSPPALIPDAKSRLNPSLVIPHTPPSRPHSTSVLPTTTTTISPSTPNSRTPSGSTPKRLRAASSPPSPVSSSAGKDTVQCSGVTKAGKQCTRQVKIGPPLTKINPNANIERFCFQHTKEVLGPSGFYSRKTNSWIAFEDWIPDYLQPDTQVAIRVEMEKIPSQSDVPGYIYTFEIRDPRTPKQVQLKVGRAVNLVKRIDQWGKQCGSKEQVLRGWWPGTVEDSGDAASGSLMKGRVKAGDKGPWCHRLERLVHLELADLAIHAPYLDPSFPKGKASSGNSAGSSQSTPSPRKAGAASNKPTDKRCPDCGTIHKEIFIFTRVETGRYRGKEWENIVKPVIEKWGAFVEAYI